MTEWQKPESSLYVAFEEAKPFDSAEPEKGLMWAVLRTAMEDLQKQGEPYRDARRYLLSSEEQYLFSFISVCQHLNLCPRTIRTMLGLPRDSSRSMQSTQAA